MDEQLDALIDRWHHLKPGDEGYGQELHEYLGMSWEMYRRVIRSHRRLVEGPFLRDPL